MQLINPAALEKWQNRDDVVLIDIRTEEEYQEGHIQGSINAPLDTITTFDFSPYEQKTAIFLCRRGRRTQITAPILESLNFKEHYCLDGGITAWQKTGLPITTD